MKKILLTIIFLAIKTASHGQGFIVDQQSTNLSEGVAYPQFNQPVGQSFTPSLATLNFVVLYLSDGNFQTVTGGTVYVNLRSGSINGTILATSSSAFVPDAFFGTTNFFFNSTVTLNPGTVYYLQPVIQSGNPSIGCPLTDGTYTGGALIQDGILISGRNLWFQEGVIVTPEPSSLVLLVFGGGGLAWLRKRNWRL